MRLRMIPIAAALLAAGVAQATVLPYKNLDQLVQEAEGIVIGTVRSVQTAGATPGDLHTYVTVEPQELISGKLDGPTLTLRLRGGFDGERGLHIDGAPRFAPDDRVLLFVQGNGRDLVPFVGWSQGVFRLARDERSGSDRLLDADGNAVTGLRGSHLQRDDSGHVSGAQVFGAPPLSATRSARPEGGAGSTDNGSPALLSGVTQGALPAMPAERLLERVRAAAGTGKTLASVLPGQATAIEGKAEASVLRVPAATHLNGRTGDAGAREPLRRPQAPAADQR